MTEVTERHVLNQESRRNEDFLEAMLNEFKKLNDRSGHATGDDALRACGKAWRDTLRPTDVLARMGGDEFAALLPNCDAADAARVADMLRAATPHEPGAGIGIAQWHSGESSAAMMQRADTSLYEDKRMSGAERLHDVNRLGAVRSALASSASAELDSLAAAAASALAVPVVLVSVVNDERQVFPGQCGLPLHGTSRGRRPCRTRSATTSSCREPPW